MVKRKAYAALFGIVTIDGVGDGAHELKQTPRRFRIGNPALGPETRKSRTSSEDPQKPVLFRRDVRPFLITFVGGVHRSVGSSRCLCSRL